MKVSIHQPMYLPWLGLFDRIQQSDVFVLLDNVAYSKNYFINRNKIRTKDGWLWLTIPVSTKGAFGQEIKDVNISDSNWQKQHWKSIFFSYQKAPFFKDHADALRELYAEPYKKLIDAIEAFLLYLTTNFGIKTKIIKASTLNTTEGKEALILNICKSLSADQYLAGPDSRNYLNLELWRENNIAVEFHDYEHPIYTQVHGEFEPFMSAIDLLLNQGNNSLNVLSKA